MITLFDPVTMSCWARLHEEQRNHPARKQVRNIRRNRMFAALNYPRHGVRRYSLHRPPRSDAYFHISRRSDAWVKAEMARYARLEGVR